MKLIIGGAYQGKLDYVLDNYNIEENSDENKKIKNEVFYCTYDTEIYTKIWDFDIIYGFDKLVLSLIKKEIDVLKFVNENLENLKDKIIISDDISSGVVPMNYETRLWREQLGKVLVILSKNSEEVIRVFCGIGMKLK